MANVRHHPHHSSSAKKPTPTRQKQAKPRPQPANPNAQLPLYMQFPVTNEFTFNDATVVSQQTGRGYDVVAGAVQGQRRDIALNSANAILTDGGTSSALQMSIFISDVSIDTSLSGSTAQSQLTRDFYARNFVQPSYVITGQSMDQEDYGLLCEFIHNAQHRAIANGVNNLTQLRILGRSSNGRARGFDGTRTTGNKVTLSRGDTLMPNRSSDPDQAPTGAYVNQTVKGAHQPFLAKGYVSSMPRIHERFQYAVEWQFNFVVAVNLLGLYSESQSQLRQELALEGSINDWQTLLNDAKQSGALTTTPALQAFNKTALLYASQNSGAVFGDPNIKTNTPVTSSQPVAGTPGAPTGGGKGNWQTVTATYFSPPDAGGPPACGGTFSDYGGMFYAELGFSGGAGNKLGPLFGMAELPCGYRLEVRNPANGKSAIAVKHDTGGGAAGASLDCWITLADAIGFTAIGKGPLQIRAA